MARYIEVEDPSWGRKSLFVIFEDEEGWEDPWEGFRQSEQTAHYAAMFSQVTRNSYEAALYKAPLHLIRELRLPPEISLTKVRPAICYESERCSMYEKKTCRAAVKIRPICFVPDVEDAILRNLMHEVISYWTQGTYIIVVPADVSVEGSRKA